MATRIHSHGAFSLIEVVIAIAIFSVLMVGLLESMASVKRYEAAAIIQDDLQTESDQVVRAIAADLAGSGWYFYGQKDANGDGVIQGSENADGTASKTVDFSVATTDRRLRYYPFIRTTTTTTAFPTRVDADSPMLGRNSLTTLSPWTSRLYPAWNISQIRTLATTVVTKAATQGIVIPSTPAAIPIQADAVQQLQRQSMDLAAEMVQPSNEIIFLRGATGPWSADPTANDSTPPSDLAFFPAYSQVGSTISASSGASALEWKTPGNQKSEATPNGLNVYFPSAYADDGHGSYVHRNRNLPSTDPLYHQPYGAQAWGAFLDDSGSGLQIRMQWETISADRMFQDPNPGMDDAPLPDDLREFTYAVVPSPFGFGRLVRAHTVLAGTPAPTVGVEVGNWITDASAARGYQIDKVLSDSVVRTLWMTRRHDPTLGANQIRVRLIFARVARAADGNHRSLLSRQIDQIFTMRASNNYDDQKNAAALIDIGTTNVPFTF